MPTFQAQLWPTPPLVSCDQVAQQRLVTGPLSELQCVGASQGRAAPWSQAPTSLASSLTSPYPALHSRTLPWPQDSPEAATRDPRSRAGGGQPRLLLLRLFLPTCALTDSKIHLELLVLGLKLLLWHYHHCHGNEHLSVSDSYAWPQSLCRFVFENLY